MKYHFKFHKEKDGFWAESVELEGCRTQGETMEELEENIKEALNLYLNEAEDIDIPWPKEKMKGKNIITSEVDPKIAFSVSLRKLRKDRNLSQKEVALELGLKNLYSYQRLESAKTANPALTTLFKIKKVFPELELDKVI